VNAAQVSANAVPELVDCDSSSSAGAV